MLYYISKSAIMVQTSSILFPRTADGSILKSATFPAYPRFLRNGKRRDPTIWRLHAD